MKSNGEAPKIENGGRFKSSSTNSSVSKGASTINNHKGGGGGHGKGRSGSKQFLNVGKVGDSYALTFPNALPVKQVVWAKDLREDVWRYASIVHARPRCDCPPNLSSTELKPENYDYYVHFQHMDRRLDSWVSWECIRSLEDEPPRDQSIIQHTESNAEDDHAGMDEEYLREHEENTKVKTIQKIVMGSYVVDTWYFSPYPKEYQNIETLYICEFCLSFFKHEEEVNRHQRRCQLRHPPGNEIYRENGISMFELDGNQCRVYCENLCYLSKLFLDHKTLRHPVNLFLFYVMAEIGSNGFHVTGYFSKEKYSKNNVSCILTLPQHQRKGYGKFLIGFSYALSRKEKKCGTPERPLSDLGKASYMAYWSERLVNILVAHKGRISIQDLSEMTCIETTDIIACLEENGVLKYIPGGEYVFVLPPELHSFILRKSGRMQKSICMKQLHWAPYDQHLAPYEYNPQA